MTLSEDIAIGNEIDENLLDRFEELQGRKKTDLIGRIDLTYFLLFVFSFGIVHFYAKRWSEEEIKILSKICDAKIDYKSPEDLFMASNEENNLLIHLKGKNLEIYTIESSINIKFHETVKMDYKSIEDNYETYKIKKENSQDTIISLRFNRRLFPKFKEKLDKKLKINGLNCYKNTWAPKKEIKKRKKRDIGLNNNFQNLTPFEFEEFVAKLFRNMGYSAHTTQKSGDYGIDIIAEGNNEKIAIQAKRHKASNKVGSPTVRNTLGSMHHVDADRTMIITTSKFTNPAKVQAQNSPINLWNMNILKEKVEKYML